MRIRVLGFSKQNIVSVEGVLNLFYQLPEIHRRHITVLRYDPARQVAAAINNYLEPIVPMSVQASYYESDTMNAILIWHFGSIAEFRHILCHEVGHYVFKNVLKQATRDEWLYTVRANERTTVSQYACTNSKEDFAECYASWFTQPEVLKRCPLRFQYFRSVIF